MGTQENNKLFLIPGFLPGETSADSTVGGFMRRCADYVLGTPQTTSVTAKVTPPREPEPAEDFPREIACISEQEAVELCQDMIARGYTAQAHYDIYDYSWSVEITSDSEVLTQFDTGA